MKKIIAALAVCSLAACGGGGGDSGSTNQPTTPTTPTTPSLPAFEGAFAGTITGNSNASAFEMLALEDGSFWSLYGKMSGSTFVVNGFIQGTLSTASAGTIRSTDAKDFGFAPAVPATLNGTYTSDLNFSGTVSVSNTAIGVNGSPLTSGFSYSTAATLGAISGNWSVALLNGETANISIGSTGAITGLSSLGCSFTGTITPRPSGKNVFNTSITFGAAPCLLAGQKANGVGVVSTLTNGQKQLIVAVVDSNRTVGTAAFGVK